MIISHKHKFLFIKTRKTAGSSLEKCLFPFLDKETDICTGGTYKDGYPKLNFNYVSPKGTRWTHYTKQEFLDYLGGEVGFQKIEPYYKFAVERQPWEKAVSMYFWLNQTNTKDIDQYKNFDDWIRRAPTLHLHDYQHYNNLADKVYRYENLQPLFDDLKNLFDIDIKQKFENTWCKFYIRPDWKKFYENEENVFIIQERLKESIEYMGYTFEEFYD